MLQKTILKNPKVQILGTVFLFFVQLYADNIYFHILSVIL